jgi:aspartate/methionine/tyrosine aminotransferase
MKINPFTLERYFSEFEFSARYLLSSSDCEPLALRDLLDMADPEALGLWNNLKLAYTESLGLPILREEIAKMYDSVSAEQVMVVNPEEGIFISMQTLLEPGDEVITTFPGYQSLYEIAVSKGCKTGRWAPDENNKFSVDELENLLTEKTRMLVINFPHNPTGAHLSRSDFERLIGLVRDRNILLFSDEMYRYLEYSEEDRLPSACEVYQNSITLCGMSKSFSLPGLRLGWLIIHDEEKLKKIQSYKDYTTICPPAPSEILSLIALRNREKIVKTNLDIIRKNLRFVAEFAERNPDFIRWIPPKAGSIAFPEIFVREEVEYFCRCLTKKTGVMLLPSSVYGYDKNRVRIGLGRVDFEEGLKVLEGFVV